jgi:hypothetical protein
MVNTERENQILDVVNQKSKKIYFSHKIKIEEEVVRTTLQEGGIIAITKEKKEKI